MKMPTILLVIGIILTLVSCSSEQETLPEAVYHVEVTAYGNSPEIFVTHKGYTSRYAFASYFGYLDPGDVITVLSQSVFIDNTHNYGTPNVKITSHLIIRINGITVKEGSEYIAYQIK